MMRYSDLILLQRIFVWLGLIVLLILNKPLLPAARHPSSDQVMHTSINYNNSRSSWSDQVVCMEHVLQYLPMGRGYRKKQRNPKNLPMMHPNHFDARSSHWNGAQRLTNLALPSDESCIIWEVGAFKNARDSQDLIAKYPHCKFHAFEPVPPFYKELEAQFRDNPKLETHNYGLGKERSSFMLDPATLNDEGTFLEDAEGGTIEAKIMPFDYAVKDCGGKVPSLLQMNCEGCEWTLIPQAIEAKFLHKIPIVQIATHNYPVRTNETESIGRRAWQLCEMRGMLKKTHRMTRGVPFAWETWELKTLL